MLKELVKNKRSFLDVSQAKLSEMTKGRVSRSTVAAIEAGNITNPTLDVAWELSKALGVDFDELVRACGYLATPSTTPTLDSVKRQAMELPTADRLTLVQQIIEDLK